MAGCARWLVLALFWTVLALSGTGPGTVLAPVPALRLAGTGAIIPPYMHSSDPVQCARLRTTLPPRTPGTPPAPAGATRSSPHSPACTRDTRDTSWAHSWLHPWPDSLLMSPGPVHWPALPADRHPWFTNRRHLAPCLILYYGHTGPWVPCSSACLRALSHLAILVSFSPA